MTSVLYAEALRQLNAGGGAAREELRRWIDSGDLLTWSAVYALLDQTSEVLGPDDTADFMRGYLLRCIEENPTPGDYLHGGFEAAWELAGRLKQWRTRGGKAAGVIRGIAVELERLYRRGDPATQSRVSCGVLEHAFEDPALRPYFANWERDPELREAYTLAVEWGAAHE